MTTTAEMTDIEKCEEWHNMQMCAKANGNKIYKVIVQQQQDYEIYQTSFIEDGFRNKTEVKDFYYGDGYGRNRHFGNEELFRHFSCFEQEEIEAKANEHPTTINKLPQSTKARRSTLPPIAQIQMAANAPSPMSRDMGALFVPGWAGGRCGSHTL